MRDARSAINNAIYEELGERWHSAQDDPVALLRAEARLRAPWIMDVLRRERAARILDIGCGGGFLSNPLAREGFSVHAIDVSADSLRVAREHDASGSVRYQKADARALPFDDGAFDAACAMDFLEHVEEPGRVIAEASRVLRPGGLFFFCTFNRNPLAGLIVIKGLEWFVRNTPPRMHRYRLFIRPRELLGMAAKAGLEMMELRGSRPIVNRAFFKLLGSGSVPRDFEFCWSRSLAIAYAGYARKS